MSYFIICNCMYNIELEHSMEKFNNLFSRFDLLSQMDLRDQVKHVCIKFIPLGLYKGYSIKFV